MGLGNIRGAIGNIVNSADNWLDGVVGNTYTKVQNIVGTLDASLSNLWSGGFTGISEQGLQELKTQIGKYCTDIEQAISGFDQNGDISGAFKGKMQDSAYEFIEAVKLLLQAYVSTMRQSIADADNAYQSYVNADTDIQSDVQQAATEIRSNANEIKLD